jgi:hypothetical protein
MPEPTRGYDGTGPVLPAGLVVLFEVLLGAMVSFATWVVLGLQGIAENVDHDAPPGWAQVVLVALPTVASIVWAGRRACGPGGRTACRAAVLATVATWVVVVVVS